MLHIPGFWNPILYKLIHCTSFYFEIALQIQFTQEEWQSILFLPTKEDGISLDWPEKEVQRFKLIFVFDVRWQNFCFLRKAVHFLNRKSTTLQCWKSLQKDFVKMKEAALVQKRSITLLLPLHHLIQLCKGPLLEQFYAYTYICSWNYQSFLGFTF